MQSDAQSIIPVFEPADTASSANFAMRLEGPCRTGRMDTSLGEKHPSFPYLELTGKGSKVSFQLPAIWAQEDLTLEIQEVHSRRDYPFVYQVWANGEPIYNRTYAPCCDGVNHYFIHIDGPITGEPVSIRIENGSDTPARLFRIYGYPDALRLAKEEGVNAPMQLGLFTPGLSGDEEQDIRRLRETRDRYAPYPVMFGWDIFYIRYSREELYQRLDYLLHLSCRAQVPIALDLNSWWSGTPVGMDGLGGNWRDLAYHQVIYDPKDATGYGVYQLTTPNYWKNMPWLTMNNAHYNAARAARLTDAAAHLRRRIAQYRAQGKLLPPVTLFTENEPDYWHYGAWNDSSDSIPGMEPCAVRAAAEEGVCLDPASGTDVNRQRDWLWKNLTDYIVGVGEAIRAGAETDAITVSSSAAHLPNSQLLEHSYTHAALGRSNQPYPDESHALWETHLIDSLRLGYQGGPGAEDSREMDYATCYGRLAGVNKEQLKEATYSLLPYAYMYGADFQMIFNYLHCENSLQNAPVPSDYEEQPVPVHSYDRKIWEYSFDHPACLNPGDRLTASEGMHLSTARGSRAVGVDDEVQFGFLTFHIHSDSGFPTGLITELTATINAGTSDFIELGYAPDQPILRRELTGRHQYVAGYRTDWSDQLDRNAKDVYLRVAIPGGLNFAEYNVSEKNSVCRLSVLQPHEKPSGHTDGFAFTFGQMRFLYRLSERREDARRLLKGCANPELAAKLQPLFDRGRYQTIYNLLLQERSTTLPAAFFVQDEGPLGERSITVRTDAPVWVTLFFEDESSYRLRIESVDERETNVRLSLSGRRFDSRWDGDVLVLKTADHGEMEMTLQVKPFVKPLPESIRGRILRVEENLLRIQTQDTALTFYADTIPLPMSSGCRCFRSAEDSGVCPAIVTPQEITPDMAVTLRTDGREVVEIHGMTGCIQGEVTEVAEAVIVGELRQPWVTVTDGKRQVKAEIGSECRLDFTGATGSSLAVSRIGHMGLQTGQRVRMRYLPEDAYGHRRALEIADADIG